jgi:hypothetical protein
MNEKINIKSYGKVLVDQERSKILHYYECEYARCRDQIIDAYNTGLKGCIYEVPIDSLLYSKWGEDQRNECCLMILKKLRKNGFKCGFEFPSRIIIEVKKQVVEDTFCTKSSEIKNELLAEHKKTILEKYSKNEY